MPGCSISVYPTTGVPQLRGSQPQGIPPEGYPFVRVIHLWVFHLSGISPQGYPT